MTAIVGMALGKEPAGMRSPTAESHPHTTANFLLPDSQESVSYSSSFFSTDNWMWKKFETS